MPIPFQQTFSLSLSLSFSLPPICPIPYSVLPVTIPHKYLDDLVKDHYCNKLIESKQMFHFGIAHNIIYCDKEANKLTLR
jgi:hypothetical protein